MKTSKEEEGMGGFDGYYNNKNLFTRNNQEQDYGMVQIVILVVLLQRSTYKKTLISLPKNDPLSVLLP